MILEETMDEFLKKQGLSKQERECNATKKVVTCLMGDGIEQNQREWQRMAMESVGKLEAMAKSAQNAYDRALDDMTDERAKNAFRLFSHVISVGKDFAMLYRNSNADRTDLAKMMMKQFDAASYITWAYLTGERPSQKDDDET